MDSTEVVVNPTQQEMSWMPLPLPLVSPTFVEELDGFLVADEQFTDDIKEMARIERQVFHQLSEFYH